MARGLLDGQSGAGMVPMYLGVLIRREQPAHSATAKRFLQICSFIQAELENPRKSPQVDYDLYINCCRRRELAADLIGFGCEPVSAAGLTPAFRQAGVVAPPDSLMDETGATFATGGQ